MLGLVHVGAYKALEEFNIEVQSVAGTSAGAIFAALIAAGYAPADLEKAALEKPFSDFIKFDIPVDVEELKRDWKNCFNEGKKTPGAFRAWRLYKKYSHLVMFLKNQFENPGVVDTAPLNKWLEGHLRRASGYLKDGPVPFEALKKPLAVVVTDLRIAQEEIFNSNDHGHLSVSQAVIASASLPFAFKPQAVDGRTLFDGGIVNNIPVSALSLFAREGESVVSFAPQDSSSYYRGTENALKLLWAVIEAAREVQSLRPRPFQGALSVIIPTSHGGLDFGMSVADRRILIQDGYREAKKGLAGLKRFVPDE